MRERFEVGCLRFIGIRRLILRENIKKESEYWRLLTGRKKVLESLSLKCQRGF